MDIEVDEDGWAAIHHCVAAEKELLMSIEKFINMNADTLEFETQDRDRRTPLLLATHCNKKKSVEKLLDLGANIKAVDDHNHGVIELCVMNENINLLHYFIDLQDENLNVWRLLIKFLSADTDEETEKNSLMLNRLTASPHTPESDGECTDPHWEHLVQAGAIPALVKACQSVSANNVVKLNIVHTLKNLVYHNTVPESIVKAGGIEMFLDLIKHGVKTSYEPTFQCLQELAKYSVDNVKRIMNGGYLSIVVKLLQGTEKLSAVVLTNAILIVGHISCVSEELKKTVGSTSSLFDNLNALFENPEYQTSVPLLTALTHTIGAIVSDNEENQNRCIDAGGATHLIMVSRASKYKELQINAIKALYGLTVGNRYASKNVLDEGAVMPLMQILKKSRAISLQEAIARTLWSLAGPDNNERRSMASMMGVNLLIEFLSAQGENADNLNYIGCEGLAVLAQGAVNKQSMIYDANGINPLVRLLRSTSQDVVVSALRALRYLCLNVAFVPNPQIQTAISLTRGLKFLVALMAYSKMEAIQVEAALTLGAAVLGNSENLASLHENPDFTYLHIIRLLYSSNEIVQLTAGSALATFSFNNVTQQQEIAECGGVRWQNFLDFLQSKNDFYAVTSAFQAVVMSRIIPDEEPALSSANGINMLVGILQKTNSDDIRALASDCVARLAHTRAGVPAAMIAVNVVEHLCKLLKSSSEQVRGCAAVALGYLSFDHTAERQILHTCREDPYLIHVIKYYTKNFKLSSGFLEGWKHCVHVGLHISPDVNSTELIQSLSQTISREFLKTPKDMSLPLISLTEDAGTNRSQSHHPHSSRASQLLERIHDDMSQIYGRSTRSSRITQHSGVTSNMRSNGTRENISPSIAENSISQASHISSVVQEEKT